MDSDVARWRSAVAGVLAKSTRRDAADLPAEPERLLDSPTYEGFPIRPLYTSLDALPEPALPGRWPYVRGGDALRDVKSGWQVAEAFPGRRNRGGRRQWRGARRLDRRRQRAGAARGRTGGCRRPSWTACSTVCSSTLCRRVRSRCRLCRRHGGAAAPADRSRRGSAFAAVGGPRRRPVDRTAERATGAERRRRRGDRGRQGERIRRRSARDHRRRSRHSTIWAPARRGNWPAASRRRSPTCGCSGKAASRCRMRCGRSVSATPPTTTSS